MHRTAAPSVSIIVPTRNEAAGIAATLTALQPLRREGCEVLVADGDSSDATRARARGLADAIIAAPPGRARQMNAGARQAKATLLLFLHADTFLPDTALNALRGVSAQDRRWGRFDVRLSGAHPLLRVVESLMNLRSRLTGIATGDQALFVERALFEAVGGYPDIPLMEDIALSKALKHHGPPLCLRARVVTSSRRWEQGGMLRTIGLMWRLRFAYWRGADPAHLARIYRAQA